MLKKDLLEWSLLYPAPTLAHVVHNLVEQPTSTKIDKYIIDPNNSRHNGGRNEKNILYHFSRFYRQTGLAILLHVYHWASRGYLSLGILVSYDHTCSQNYTEKWQCPLPDTKTLTQSRKGYDFQANTELKNAGQSISPRYKCEQ